MSRPYHPLAILRVVPPELLQAYCDAHKIPLDPRAFAPSTTSLQVTALSRGLSPDIRPRFDAALQHVHDLATEEGTQRLVDEALVRQVALPDDYLTLAGHATRALWFLTYHRDAFYDAHRLHAADHLSARSSTAVDGLHATLPPHATSDLSAIRRAVAEYFQTTQLRGRQCHIDALVRGSRLLLFVYMDDYPATHVSFDQDNHLERRIHRPAFQVVFQFNNAKGTLSAFAKGKQRLRLDLLELFCRHLLGVERPSGVVLRPKFRLDHLLRRDAVLPLDPTGGVTGARIRRLRVCAPRMFESVTLEAAPEGGWDDIHRMLDRHFPIAEFPRDDLIVTMVTMVTMVTITVGYTAGGKARVFSFDLTSKGSTTLTSLADDQQDLGERLLRVWAVTDV